MRSDSGTVPPYAIKRGEPVWGETMTEAMTNDTVNTTVTKSVDVGGIKNSPDSLRDMAARVDQALAAEAATFEARAERLRNVLDGIIGIELSAHERTRLMLQVAYSDCLYVLNNEAGQKEFAIASTERGIPQASNDENKFLPIVKTIWGRFVEEAANEQNGKPQKVWKHNRSAEKYASVFRYLLDNAVSPDGVAQHIENYEHQQYGRKINGIIAADRAKYGSAGTRRVNTYSVTAGKLLSSKGMKHFSTVKKPSFIQASEGAVVLVARVVDGNLQLLGDISLETAIIEKGVVELAKRLEETTSEASNKHAEQSVQEVPLDIGNTSKYKEFVVSTAKEGAVAA